MRTLPTIRPILIALLALTLVVATKVGVAAATANANVTIVSGGLTITYESGSVNFGTVTLNGDDQTVVSSSSPTFRIKDASGTNAGWNVTFQAIDFASGGNTISVSNFRFNPTGGTITRVSGQAVNATNGPKETGGGAVDLSTARKVLTTAAGYGKGRYDYTGLAGNFSLFVGAETLAGDYASTLTATVSSGP